VLYDQMDEGIAVYRRNGTCLYLNAVTERILGKSKSEIEGHILWEVFPEAVGNLFYQAFQRVAETGVAEEFEHHYVPWERWFINRIFRSGERVYVFGREVTEAKRLEAERAEYYERVKRLNEETQRAEQRAAFLARSSEVLASSLVSDQILHGLAHLVVPTLADWCAVDVPAGDKEIRRIVVAHERPERVEQALEFHRRFPLSLDDPGAVGKVLRTGTPEFVPELSEEIIELEPNPEKRRAIRALGIQTYVCVPLMSRGRTLAALTLVYAESGRRYTEADIRLVEDFARRAATSLDNGLLYEEAREAIRARDTFLSVASHELNTPLTSLHLSIQALQREFAQPVLQREVVHAKLQVLKRQSSRLASLIRELLDVSRITLGKLKLEEEDVDLVVLVREAVPRFADDLARAGGELSVDVPESAIGRWDRLRLEQVLQNLLSNAIKYGQGKPIDLRIEADERRVRLSVRDRGIGMSAEGQARLFQRFERLASERNYSGFGLGLWIVKQIIDAMEGSIHVESAPGQGSVFTVELPRQRAGGGEPG
jgi:PAS domain S-box-containing protein